MHKPYGPYERYFKRPLDLLCGLLAVIVFCWLYLILIILGTIFMHGNPFFMQERPGKNGKIFKLIKFRSMDNRKDKDGNLLPDSVRLNKYGRFIRKTSLDELPEFNKNTLEVLRGPLEDGIISISRVNASLTYPCNFMFVASMNPCPCGFYGSKEKECTCSPQAIQRYMGKISGPLLDRIDIQIEVTAVKYQKPERMADQGS